MQYTKTMIDLIFQIRKSAPAPIRPRIKLSSPTLLDTLLDIYKVVDDKQLKILIYELLTHAGQAWVNRLTSPPDIPVLTAVASKPIETEEQKPSKPMERKEKVVIYRGQRMVVPA